MSHTDQRHTGDGLLRTEDHCVTPASDIAIETIDLTTGYHTSGRDKIISTSLQTQLRRGELISLLGPNGAGKSTLLRTLSGFQDPVSGDIKLFGRSLSEYSSRELSYLLSVVLTEKPLLQDMDVETLVGLGRTPYTGFWGRLHRNDHEIIENALSLTGLTPLRHRTISTLSDGERQKAMIAKAFAQNTPVIILDEPTAFLDYPSKVEIMLLLREMAHTQRMTIFLSTHDLDIAFQTSDQLWLLDREHGLTTGTIDHLTATGAIERYFNRPGVTYDPHTGHFRITGETPEIVVP
ncbi:MAG: ABC transporter ATP-binding protein [Muribaculaceae bacterium]|nr:ABC transporter ATP-binding protein [Muribaculaceae bacterium]